MKIGVAKEIKPQEYRVALTNAGVLDLATRGHEVVVETGAGAGSAITDDDYRAAGASIVDVDTVWSESEMVLKVKEPLRRRVAEALARAGPLHVPAPRRRASADAGAGRHAARSASPTRRSRRPTAGCRCWRR